MEDEYVETNKLCEIFKEIDTKEKELKTEWREKLNGLIDVDGLYSWLENNDFWSPIDIVDIVETDEKSFGYQSYQHARIVNDKEDLYLKQGLYEDDNFDGVDHYYVWQTCGYCGDDYSGFLLIPLNNNRYFKVYYTC